MPGARRYGGERTEHQKPERSGSVAHVRRLLYITPIQQMADGFQRLVAYGTDPSPADSTTLDAILRDLQTARRRASAQDRALLARISKVMSKDQREELLNRYQTFLQQQQAKLDAAAQ